MTVQPLYFGTACRQLYGAYHPPQARRATEAAVLLCYPLMQEYNRTHWAFRKLAAALTQEGFHVLRFDWYGTGDSAGAGADVSLQQWGADLKAAAMELQDLSSARRLSIVGFRFGALMAVLGSSAGLAVRDLVLWEPPADGFRHLAEIKAIELSNYRSLPHPPVSGPEELFQYPLPDAMRRAIEAVRPGGLPPCQADRILIFAESARPELDELARVLRDRTGRRPEVQVVAEESKDRHEGALLSTRAQQAITAALAGGAA